MAKKQICILGAGLAGLSAGWHLRQNGIETSIFEKELQPGGLCRSKNVDGFIFDYDGHLLHCKHGYTLDFIRRQLGIDMVKHERSAWVYTNGVFCKYPFQANLFGLPGRIVSECLLGFIKASQGGDGHSLPADATFLDWIRSTFGAGIAKHFMVPYNTKFWTVSPAQLNCDWLDNFIPVPSLSQLVEGSVQSGRHQFGYNKSFWYPRSGGIGQIPDALAQRLPRLNTGCRVAEIHLKKKFIRLCTGRTIKYDALISTIPLPELAQIIQGIPKAVKPLFSALRWNSVLNVNLATERQNIAQKHWIYFPQKQLSFFRVGFFHNISKSIVPRGKGSMYVEIAYSKNRPIDKKKEIERAIGQLRRIGILRRSDVISCRDVNDIQYGYPLYDKAYRSASTGITKFLKAHDFIPAGRYGAWKYFSMEDSILDGKRAADEVSGIF